MNGGWSGGSRGFEQPRMSRPVSPPHGRGMSAPRGNSGGGGGISRPPSGGSGGGGIRGNSSIGGGHGRRF